jgi:cytochrome bd-type quinol oxidase subunit 2
MASHLVALLVFSALVAVVFALLQRQQKRERIRFGVMAFGAFVLSALVVGWLMFPFPS